MRRQRFMNPRVIIFTSLILALALLAACGGAAPADTPGAAAPTAVPTAVSQPATAPPQATAVPAASPAAVAPDAGYLRAVEPNPRRGGTLKWGGIASSTLYDLHQTNSIANMGPQRPMYDLLVQVDPIGWKEVIPDLATNWRVSGGRADLYFRHPGGGDVP